MTFLFITWFIVAHKLTLCVFEIVFILCLFCVSRDTRSYGVVMRFGVRSLVCSFCVLKHTCCVAVF